MPLNTIDPPIAAYEVVRSTVANLAAQAGFGTPALRRADPAALAISTPHRMAVLALNRIQEAKDLRSVVDFKGWRFLVHHQTTIVAAADAVEVGTNEYRLGQLNEGPFVNGTETAIRRAEGHDAIVKGRFAPVFLLVPAVYVAALWLEDQQADNDLVMAMPPVANDFVAFNPMPTGAFLTGLKRLAAQVPAATEKAKNRSGG